MQKMAIVAENVVRRFGQHTAVDGLNLHIPRGSIYGFLGPNGCGKSTSIRMLTGLLTPDSGHINVLGLELPRQAEALKLRIGYMTQKFSLFSDLTLKENLLFMARIYGLPRSQRRPRVDELLEQYELMPMQKQLAGTMSGGQKQRLALAAATLHKPELLFLDEPTSAVDPENRRDFWEKLFDLSDAGTTILVSTHYMDEAERCHQLGFLANGRLCNQGTPQALLAQLDERVVEIAGGNLRQVKEKVLRLPRVESAAQQGLQLRVLMHRGTADPASYLRQQLADDTLILIPAKPSLEDVFVASTTVGAAR